jgi:dienelactone hydrolase
VLGRAAAVTVTMVILTGAAAASPKAFPRFGVGCVRADFHSGGKLIRAERCGSNALRSAVVVLHGCGGFGTFDHSLAADLPRLGIATLDVDYFALTPPPGRRGFCSVWTQPARLFARWEEVAVAAADSLRRDYAHVGAVGWSLGGGVAIAAAEGRHSFDAVAAFSALASPESLARVGSLPPSIFLDGGGHDIVSPENARALYRAARQANVPSALYVYPAGTHEWPGRQGVLGRARAAAFLLRYLA